MLLEFRPSVVRHYSLILLILISSNLPQRKQEDLPPGSLHSPCCHCSFCVVSVRQHCTASTTHCEILGSYLQQRHQHYVFRALIYAEFQITPVKS